MTTPLLLRLRRVEQSRYAIDREIGPEGSWERVLAEDRERGGAVVLHVASVDSGVARDRIARAAALSHPHVLEITDHGEEAGLAYYATPLSDGVTLRTWLERETRLPILESVRVLRETAEALFHAHGRGVVHGALRPECVVWARTHVLLTGFSFAAREESAAADVRALSSIGYEILAGRPPEPRATPPVNALRHDLPPGLAYLVMRSLGESPPGMDEVVRVLRSLVTPAPGYEAMQLVRQARYLALRGGDDGIDGALDRLRRAAEIDPRLAAAREGIKAAEARRNRQR